MLLLKVAQVKCYNCGRTCGEVKGRTVHELNIESAYIPQYAGEYGLDERNPRRCKRCGGSVYIDDPFTASAGELATPQDGLHLTGVKG